MTCKTCQTTPLTCTEIADRSFNSSGEVVLCKAYKAYRRTINISLSHAALVIVALVALVAGISYISGHDRGWRIASEQSGRDVITMLKDGASGKQAFFLPGSNIRLNPRRDGQVNMGGEK